MLFSHFSLAIAGTLKKQACFSSVSRHCFSCRDTETDLEERDRRFGFVPIRPGSTGFEAGWKQVRFGLDWSLVQSEFSSVEV